MHIVQFEGTYSHELHKIVYLQNRRYLESDNSLRYDKRNFPTKAVEFRCAPSHRNYETLKSMHKAYDAVISK